MLPLRREKRSQTRQRETEEEGIEDRGREKEEREGGRMKEWTRYRKDGKKGGYQKREHRQEQRLEKERM